jgi:hypothetical protein
VYIRVIPGFPVYQAAPADDIPIDTLNLYVRSILMGFATHLGPWLLGTVKNTSGTTAGTIRNMGATTVTQSNTTTVSDTSAVTLFVLPAGAQITNFFVDITTAYAGTTGNTITIQTAGGSSLATVGSASTTPLSTGRASVTLTAAQIGTILNVGTSDLIVQVIYACAGTASGGAATITCQYIVKGSDGSANPASV